MTERWIKATLASDPSSEYQGDDIAYINMAYVACLSWDANDNTTKIAYSDGNFDYVKETPEHFLPGTV